MVKQDDVLVFLNAIAPRVGPVNAIALLKDAQLAALFDILKTLGVSQETIDKTIAEHVQKTAQNILKMPVPSPIQRVK